MWVITNQYVTTLTSNGTVNSSSQPIASFVIAEKAFRIMVVRKLESVTIMPPVPGTVD
jgi:hypothetical protein